MPRSRTFLQRRDCYCERTTWGNENKPRMSRADQNWSDWGPRSGRRGGMMGGRGGMMGERNFLEDIFNWFADKFSLTG